MTTRLGPDTRQTYKHYTDISTRWMDNDCYGHVNNVIYYSWFDTAVNGMLLAQKIAGAASPEAIALVVKTGCEYFESVSFPQPVEIGLRVIKLGSSSATYELGVFTPDQPLCHARGTFVHVYVDPATRRPIQIPQRHREVLNQYLTLE
ncbi:acyl-CoA thioesterase [Alcaligenaceae bacterium]|nr:acyl-CoA thioesterase [Alcaligenaceae bacterium]